MKKLEDTGLNISVETSIYDHIDYLLQQIEIKDKALEFYADGDNYNKTPYSTFLKEGGERARAALKGEDTNE
ncbi:hypothetical protein D1872_202160 [compost metagenome]